MIREHAVIELDAHSAGTDEGASPMRRARREEELTAEGKRMISKSEKIEKQRCSRVSVNTSKIEIEHTDNESKLSPQ